MTEKKKVQKNLTTENENPFLEFLGKKFQTTKKSIGFKSD